MKKFDRARFFPIFFLLLISLLLLGGGCGGGSSGNGTRILSMKPASPDTVNLESYTTDLEWLRNVDVAVHISASEPIDSLLCFLHLVSGDVEYDASTYRVSDLRSSANVRAANEEDPPSWIATALIEGITPGQTEYVATFDVLNALEGSISEQFVQGAKVSGVFHIDENLSDQETPEYYYVGSMTTPEPDPDTFFELSVKRIEVGSAHFLPENEGETVYDPSDPSNSSGEIYLGIPVTIKLAPQNSAVTAVTIQSASGNGNITFGDPGITAMTRILPSNTESVEMDKIDGGLPSWYSVRIRSIFSLPRTRAPSRSKRSPSGRLRTASFSASLSSWASESPAAFRLRTSWTISPERTWPPD